MIDMTVEAPSSLARALEVLAADPDTQILAGGTDFMVEVNFGHRRPARVITIGHIPEVHGWRQTGQSVWLGAGLTYTEMLDPSLASLVPALAQAARTVGSPQIRNAGTIGGNLGTGSPAGDTLPVLAAYNAVVVLVSAAAGQREVPLEEFITGVKRTSRRPDELILGVTVPVLRGGQEYLKVGTRNAMVISVAGVAVVVDLDGRNVRCALGSVGPVPIRAGEAEQFIADRVDWPAAQLVDRRDAVRFGELVAQAARPITDHRSTADYRRHAVGVCARRALERVL
jgi:CO/xanthine dehydrogenase FAD-binding subunit